MKDYDNQSEISQQRKTILDRFKISDNLMAKKMLSYIPIMILTNLSTLLLVSVDGVVVGNFLGPNALSSVNIFYPATILIGVFSTLAAIGISTALSVYIGKNDREGLLQIKHASKKIMIFTAIFAAVIQIPLIYLIIESYQLSPEMHHLTWQYAIGVMIASPFGVISTVGNYQLQIIGKMKVLMGLSVMEGLINLGLDVLFVGPLKLGVAGAGYGTMVANIARCTVTVIYLAKKTDIYHSPGGHSGSKEIKEILGFGVPEAVNSLMLALQNYFMMKIILSMIGEEGGAIKGVCTFALNLALVLINSTRSSMRPLAGIYNGGKDVELFARLVRRGMVLIALLVGGFFVFCLLEPEFFYWANGVKEIPENGIFMLLLFATHFVFRGLNAIFRLNFAYSKNTRFTTILTIVGNALLPIFAFLLSSLIDPIWLWASYFLTETVILTANLVFYSKKRKKQKEETQKDLGLFHLTLTPDEAIEASTVIRDYAERNGFDKKVAYRIALCIEEMAAYAVKSQKNKKLNIQITIKFQENGAIFTMLDDGQCIALDKDEEAQQLTTDNYGLLKKLAKTVEYQYILDMNYTIFTF